MSVSLSSADASQRIAELQASLPPTVRLIGVTKKKPSEVIRVAYAAGLRDFGESQVQEAMTKQAELSDLTGITWHLIGHLQTNKARRALLHFDWIHSVDSLKLAHKLNDLAAELGRTPYCCLQVKMVPDPPKYGFTVDELWEALPALNELPHLNIVGLMTIPPQESSIEEIEDIFNQARTLAGQITQKGYPRLQMTELSMGMSSDYSIAIAAGATMIRVGTILFGDRPT
jgi:hypothetical protein